MVKSNTHARACTHTFSNFADYELAWLKIPIPKPSPKGSDLKGGGWGSIRFECRWTIFKKHWMSQCFKPQNLHTAKKRIPNFLELFHKLLPHIWKLPQLSYAVGAVTPILPSWTNFGQVSLCLICVRGKHIQPDLIHLFWGQNATGPMKAICKG